MPACRLFHPGARLRSDVPGKTDRLSPPILLVLFLGLIVLAMGAVAVNRVRDLASGVARVQEDLLERSWRSRGSRGSKSRRGKFERLGTMRLSSRAYGQGQDGFRYRVCYSPASRIVWSLEELP